MGPLELLYSSIGFVHETTGPPNSPLETFRDFLRPPLGIHPSVDGIRIVSNRDQLEALLVPDRTEVRDYSGDVEKGSSKLVDIIFQVMRLRELSALTSYDINFVAESENTSDESVEAWLGKHFLNQSLADSLGASPDCHSVVMSYQHGEKTQVVELTETSDTRVIIRYLTQEEATTLPDCGQLQSEVQGQYADFTDLMKKVGFE